MNALYLHSLNRMVELTDRCKDYGPCLHHEIKSWCDNFDICVQIETIYNSKDWVVGYKLHFTSQSDMILFKLRWFDKYS